MQSNPGALVNLLVISVKTLVNLPVKPTTGGIRPSLVEILDFQGLVYRGLRRISKALTEVGGDDGDYGDNGDHGDYETNVRLIAY